MRYFEDFEVGSSEPYGSLTIREDEMLAFAAEFDPQPMHLDPHSEQARRMGGLIASGWYTCSANMRLMADHFILGSAGMGSPGVSSLRWAAPVRAGDHLTGGCTSSIASPLPASRIAASCNTGSNCITSTVNWSWIRST